MTHCLASRSWVAEGLSAVALSLSPSPCVPVSKSVENGNAGLWSASVIACALIADCVN